QSLGGYRLRWGRDAGLRARVGELVGLSAVGGADERDWMVGVIRWLRHEPQGDGDAGVELRARRAHAVGLRQMDATGHSRTALRAIQIDCLRAAGTQALHFLVPAVLDAGANRIEVSRAVEPDDFESSGVPISECSDILVLEN